MTADRINELMAYLDRRDAGFDRERLRLLAREIQATGHERDDPVREIMSRLGDRWSSLIIFILATGRYRHAALRRIIAVVSAEAEISQRMLTQTLKDLQRDGLVNRKVFPTVPPGVEYRLSDLGHSLLTPLEALVAWAENNHPAIRQARMEFRIEAE